MCAAFHRHLKRSGSPAPARPWSLQGFMKKTSFSIPRKVGLSQALRQLLRIRTQTPETSAQVDRIPNQSQRVVLTFKRP